MRKIERIWISVADRERLERLVRDRNTPQKVVWRARIVLLASDGLTAEGICGGRGQEPADGPSLAPPLRGEGDGRAVEGCDPPVARQAVDAREDQAGGPHDAACEAAECDPLEPAQHGCGGRGLLQQCPADMACARAQAAFGRNVQSLARQELRGQGRGRGRALPRSTRQGAGLLRRRKEIPWGVDSDRRSGRVRLLTHPLWRRPCKLSLTDPNR